MLAGSFVDYVRNTEDDSSLKTIRHFHDWKLISGLEWRLRLKMEVSGTATIAMCRRAYIPGAVVRVRWPSLETLFTFLDSLVLLRRFLFSAMMCNYAGQCPRALYSH